MALSSSAGEAFRSGRVVERERLCVCVSQVSIESRATQLSLRGEGRVLEAPEGRGQTPSHLGEKHGRDGRGSPVPEGSRGWTLDHAAAIGVRRHRITVS